jgi:Lectin C-type domain
MDKPLHLWVFYVIATTAFTATLSQADSNRFEWPHNRSFYQRFDQPMTWAGAQAKCRAEGANLVTITTEAERDFINNNLFRNNAFWIGASDTTKNGHFTWVSGEKWAYKQGGSKFLVTSEVDYVWASPYEWGTNKATDLNGYICEWSSHGYLDVADVPDINNNGVNEVALLYVDYVTKRHTVKVRDPKTDTTLATLTFKMGSNPPGFVVIEDLNGNGTPEIGLLYSEINGEYSAFGQPTLEIKDLGNNKGYLKRIAFLNASFKPRGVSLVADSNGNGSSEIAVLGINKGTNLPKLEIRDSKTGEILNNTDF